MDGTYIYIYLNSTASNKAKLQTITQLSLVPRTRSTIEVEHFRYFVSERRGSLSPNRRNVNLDFETKRFLDSGHGNIRRDAIRFFLLKSVFG